MPLGTALVTGASSGIGEVFARRLAQRNWDVVLVARRLDRLEAIAAALTESYGIKATPLQADLVDPQAPEALKEKLGEAEIRVDYLVNNAGLGMGGAFISQPYQKIETTLQLNIAALTKLTYLFLPAMLERKRGFICNVASTGAFQPVPHFAVYAATKAYVLHFTEALAEELAGTGVTASCLCPGATTTEFNDHSGVNSDFARFAYQSPEEVVDAAIAGMDRGETVVVPGMLNQVHVGAVRLTPRTVVRKLAGIIYHRSLQP